MRLGDAAGHDDALPGGQPVGLDDDRRAALLDPGARGSGVGEGRVVGGRNAVALHERLGEVFRRFELRGALRGPEDAQPPRAEEVDDAGGQRSFRADDGERDFLALGERGERPEIGDRDVLEAALACGAAVAGRDVDDLHARRARQPPRERMLAPARADHEDLHVTVSSNAALV